MLKIWLTCLQPSLGVLGVVLVLSNAISAYAASKPTKVLPNKVSKGHQQQKAAKSFVQPQQFGAKGTGIAATSTPPQVVRLSGVRGAGNPDDVVRQLAIETLANSQRKTPIVATKTFQQNNNGIASFVSPSPVRISPIASTSTNTKLVRHSVNKTTHHAISPETPLVSGLFIDSGSTFDRTGRTLPNLVSPSSQPVLGSQVPNATMRASAKVLEPVPVVREPIKQFESTEVVATQASSPSNPSATTIAKGLEQFLGNEPKDLIRDSTVAKGLEQFLGNEPKSIQVDSTATVVKAIPVKTDPILALSDLVSPERAVPRNTNASGLQLATSRAYDSAAEFDLPGVASQLQAVKTAQPKVKLFAVKTVKTNLSTAIVQRKNNYLTLISDKPLKAQSQQSGATVAQGNSLGGLILGSRSSIDDAQASTNQIASLPMKVLKATNANGLGLFDSANQY